MKHKVKRRAAKRIAALAALALALWSLLAWSAARWLIVDDNQLRHADAIVVLGGAATYRERASHAARLFGEGRAGLILITNDGVRGGWSREQQRNPFFFERAVVELRRAGVAPEAIEALREPVASTYDEAVLVRSYAERLGLRSLIVVTSGYHSRRALWTYRRVLDGSGIEFGCDPVPPGVETPRPAVWWLEPRGWRSVAAELPKLLYYRLRYAREAVARRASAQVT